MNSEYLTMPTISEGSTDESVKILQEKLKILDYYSGSITGSFGPTVTDAVKNFQKDNNLPADGTVGTQTWKKLFELTPSPFGARWLRANSTLKLGNSGEEVKDLQRQLTQLLYYKGEISGVFDAETENAVKSFQMINKLTADGIVGRDTWSALTYLYEPLAACGDETTSPNAYTVKPGDTLYSIANKFNTTINEIKLKNNLSSNIISIGQTLQIPNDEEHTQISTNNYIVKPGDTLYSIANKFNTSVANLKALNNLTSDVLSIGQVLKLPAANNNTFYNTYTVKPGDTLYSIANKLNTTVNDIINTNNLATSVINIGQVLNIPTKEETSNNSYIVLKGDTLYSIANKFNTTVDNIKLKNNLSTNLLSIGQVLNI